jgi:hypothetical protein
MKKTLFWCAAFAGILAIVALIGAWQYRGDCNDIYEWGLDNQNNFQSIEKPFWKSNSPFHWNSKFHRVYKATTSTGKVVWFRFGNWGGMEVESESGDF